MCCWRLVAPGRHGHRRPSRVPGGARALPRPGEDRPWGQHRGNGVAAGGGVPARAGRVSPLRRCLGGVTPPAPLLPGPRCPPPCFPGKPLRNPPRVPWGLGAPFRRPIAAAEYLPGRLAGGQLWWQQSRDARAIRAWRGRSVFTSPPLISPSFPAGEEVQNHQLTQTFPYCLDAAALSASETRLVAVAVTLAPVTAPVWETGDG